MSVSVCVYVCVRACVRACVRVLLLFSCKLIGDFLALFRDCDDAVKDSIALALRHSRREGKKTYDRRTLPGKEASCFGPGASRFLSCLGGLSPSPRRRPRRRTTMSRPKNALSPMMLKN